MPAADRVATFGGLLRSCRLEVGLTQEALAERAGVGLRSVQLLEADGARPRRYTAAQLIAALGLPPERRAPFEAAATPAARRRPAAPTVPADGALAGRHPAIVTLAGPPPTNLPQPLGSLIGRDDDVAALRELLPSAEGRLVTLTGVGGAGKTRLALHVAAELLGAFADGVWFVEFAPTADPTLVPQVVAAALGVRDQPGAPLLDTLTGFLRPKALALVLDNCEHLVDACAALAERLLPACPGIRILATSREPLQVAGERRWRVLPLAVPDPDRVDSPDALAGYASIRLFVERARAVEPGFDLTAANAPAVAQVCARLDGIPLALELAASRVGVLAVEQIAERLDDCFQLLAGAARARPARQQTMRAALDWSHDQLGDAERAAFRRLAVFAGGWDLEAAEAIVGDGPWETGDAGYSSTPNNHHPSPDEVLDLLTLLVDKSLVMVEPMTSAARYRLLEPVRQYAHRQLAVRGETDDVRTRHAGWYLALAERAVPELRGPAQVAWQARLARDQDNLRAALLWAEGRGAAATGARLAVALVPFWEVHGSLSEGRRWLDAVLAAPGPLPGALRAKALLGTGRLAQWQADLDGAAARFEESRALACELGERLTVAESLTWLGTVRRRQRADADAVRLLQDGLAQHRALGDEWGAALALHNLGMVAANEGAFAQAVPFLEESLRHYRALGDVRSIAIAGLVLGTCLTVAGNLERAVGLLREGLAGLRAVADQAYLLSGLLTLAWLAAWMGQPIRAARLLGAAEALREALDATLAPVNRNSQDQALDWIRPRLGAAELAAAVAAGRALAPDEAIEEALSAVAPGPVIALTEGAPGATVAPAEPIDALTRREQEVAQLVTRDLADGEIAAALGIAVSTVGVHVHRILAKLGLRSRWQVADAMAVQTSSKVRGPKSRVPGPVTLTFGPSTSGSV
jgi:predicted ATPase/DNA-binding CsgD family transcriptional regulator/transcriptional regulator with XRE-family HTH domain